MSEQKDRYALPSAALIRARKEIVGGQPREEVAQAMLPAMLAAAKKNPKIPIAAYAEIPAHDALRILIEELCICDPSCPEHDGYKRELERQRNERTNKRNRERRKTDPAFKKKTYDNINRWRRDKQANDEEWREKKNAANREFRERMSDDLEWVEWNRFLDRERYHRNRKDPEFVKKCRQRSRDYRAQQKEKAEKDPVFAQQLRERKRLANRKYKEKQRRKKAMQNKETDDG